MPIRLRTSVRILAVRIRTHEWTYGENTKQQQQHLPTTDEELYSVDKTKQDWVSVVGADLRAWSFSEGSDQEHMSYKHTSLSVLPTEDMQHLQTLYQLLYGHARGTALEFVQGVTAVPGPGWVSVAGTRGWVWAAQRDIGQLGIPRRSHRFHDHWSHSKNQTSSHQRDLHLHLCSSQWQQAKASGSFGGTAGLVQIAPIASPFWEGYRGTDFEISLDACFMPLGRVISRCAVTMGTVAFTPNHNEWVTIVVPLPVVTSVTLLVFHSCQQVNNSLGSISWWPKRFDQLLFSQFGKT